MLSSVLPRVRNNHSEEHRDQLIAELQKNQAAMLNVLEDLDEEKHISDRERQQYLATLENIGEGVITTDKQGNITLVNRAAEDMLGYTQKELLNKTFVDVIKAETEQHEPIAEQDRLLTHALKTLQSCRLQYLYVRKNKTTVYVDTINTPIILDNNVLGVAVVFHDITKEKEVDRAKTEFVSLASHQLRTPLGIMKWYMEAMREAKYLQHLPKIAQEYLEEIYKSNERVLALVRNLLSVSRIDQGKVKNHPESVDVVALIETIIEEMKVIATKKKITLLFLKKQHTFPKISIDKFRLHEVIENLITNALQYNHPSGKVEVILDKKSSNTLLILVKDTGMGISNHDQKRLFTKFFRSEESETKNTEGSGLGLYLVKSYVEGWGGKISVTSKEGKGSTFTFSLPITTTMEGNV